MMKKVLFAVICYVVGFVQIALAQSSSPEYIKGIDTLVVYRSIPNLPEFMPRVDSGENADIRVISDKFTIRVRSAATDNIWIDVLALYTYSRAFEVPDTANMSGSNPGFNSSTSVQMYPNATAGWSQTYGNIEMSYNQPVEVEIAAKAGFMINNQNFIKATVHPSQKASLATIRDGKVYFTISNPGQVAIDINGQMDDFNAFINPIGVPPAGGVASRTIPIHTITFFANPVIVKPVLGRARTFYVTDGAMPTVSPTTYDTLYFMPGVHNIGMNNLIYPNKTVYIPGDAIIFGTLTNRGIPPQPGVTRLGQNIRIFGYGTISGARIKHPSFAPASSTAVREPINIDQGRDYRVEGITIVDGAHFLLWQPSGERGLISYVKLVGWRANGDGIGNGDNVNDCFVRTNDDCSYVRGNRKRVTYWKDNISAVFYMSQIWEDKPILIEDIDVLYLRSRGGGGAAFDMRADAPSGQRPAQVTFRNIRFHDSRSNMEIFKLVTFEGNADNPSKVGGNYNWIRFENFFIKSALVKSKLLGSILSPWNGGLTFENIFYASTLLTATNFLTYFDTNQYVFDTVFSSVNFFTITDTTNPFEGYVLNSSRQPTYAPNAMVTLTAIARPGYEFVNWSGSSTSTANQIQLTMNSNVNLKANYRLTSTMFLPRLEIDNKITVYPNPATDQFVFNSEDKSIDKIELIDFSGKAVYSRNVNYQSGTVDLTGISKGVYIVKLYSKGEFSTKKIVVK
jgi:hypothetical protein